MTTPAAPYSLATLLTPQQLADLRLQLLAFAQGDGLPAISEWAGEPTGLEMTFVDMVCQAINDLAQSGAPVDQQIASAAAARFLSLARNGWLDLLAWEVYQLLRDQATKTTFTLTLVSVATAPTYTFEVGDVWVVGPTGKRYQSTTAGDLGPGSEVEIAFAAAEVGSSYDDDPSQVTLQLATAYAGVSVSSHVGDFTVVSNSGASTGRLEPSRTAPGIVPTPHTFAVKIEVEGEPGTATYSLQVDGGSYVFGGLLNPANVLPGGTSLAAVAGVVPSFAAGDIFVFSTPGSPNYVQGDDVESDAALAGRCRDRWPSLSLNVMDAKVLLWAVTAYPSVTRVQPEPDLVVPGRFIVTLADSHGGLDQAGLNVIEAFIKARLGVGEDMTAQSAVDTPIAVTAGNVRVARGTSAEQLEATQVEANDAWVAYLGTVPIGPSSVVLAKLVEILMDAGCVDVGDVTPLALNGSAANAAVVAGAVPVAANTLIAGLTWMNS